MSRRNNQTKMKVKRWKSAFDKALNLAGWHIDDNTVEADKIREITRRILEKLNFDSSCQFRGEKLITSSLVGQIAKANLEKIWECLMNDETCRIGVYGMGGVGKTTIVTHINNRLLTVDNSSTPIYWVTVSKDSSIFKLQSDIARVIKLDLSGEDDELKRAAKLWKELDKSKKFVLILDDVWEAFESKTVGIPHLSSGRKLLLTTRKFRVCQRMECQPIKVEPLSQQEAMDLFMKEAKYQTNNSLEWKGIADSIVKECAGLPLAIIVVARSMRGVGEISEWRNTLRELKKPCEGENREMEEQVFKPLKVSYDSLPNEKYRLCLLYCSLFPEDHEIKRNDIIEYWMGEGLMDELDSRQAGLDKGNVIINELIYSSLLEQSKNDIGDIKMHDVVRDMARIITRENFSVQVGFQLQNLLEKPGWSEKLGSVLVMDKTMLNRCVSMGALNCFKLRVLLLRENYILRELPNGFFANVGNLTVLDIRFLTRLQSLPDSISQLGNLGVLFLIGCHLLKNIPYLGSLENLRHLDISYTRINEIPKGMERLVNLRVLKLSWNLSLLGVFPSAILEKLSHLQSLDFEGNALKVEPNALICLEKLETLKLNFYYLHLLNSYLRSGHWRRLGEFLICLKSGTYRTKSVQCFYKTALFLDKLRNDGQENGEADIIFPDNVQQLELVSWDSIMVNILRNKNLAHLQRLDVTMYKSKHLFTVALAQHFLHNVEELTISWAEGNLEEIIATEEKSVNQGNHNDYPTIRLPKLKSFSLLGLGKLTSIYRGRVVCPSIEFIRIHECEMLARLPFHMQMDVNEGSSRMMLPSIKLGLTGVSPIWWDSLMWSRYQLIP